MMLQGAPLTLSSDVDALTRDDIASFDEFHIRGLEATRELADLAEIEDHSRVLDVGCGISGPARTLASEFGCDVVGIDIVKEYCRAATLFTDRVGLTDSVRFQHGNALDLPSEDEVFDVVWFEHTLPNIEAKRVALEEAASGFLYPVMVRLLMKVGIRTYLGRFRQPSEEVKGH